MNTLDFSDLIGQRFSARGYGPDTFSCYGLSWEVHRRFGIHLPKTNISVIACRAATMQEIETHKTRYWRDVRRPVAPCAIMIRSLDPDYAHHFGTYIGQGKMIHVTIRRNVAIDRVRMWEPQIIGYYQYAGPDIKN